MTMSSMGTSRGRVGRSGFRRGGRSRMKRYFEWEGAAFALSQGADTVGAAILVPNTFIQEMQGPTVTRIRGNLIVQIDADSGGGVDEDEVIVAMGIQLQPTIVSTQLEDPHADANSNRWLWHQYVPLFLEDSTTLGGTRETSAVARIEIDARGKRKASDNDELVLVVRNVAAVGDAPIRVVGGTRVLFQAA